MTTMLFALSKIMEAPYVLHVVVVFDVVYNNRIEWVGISCNYSLWLSGMRQQTKVVLTVMQCSHLKIVNIISFKLSLDNSS